MSLGRLKKIIETIKDMDEDITSDMGGLSFSRKKSSEETTPDQTYFEKLKAKRWKQRQQKDANRYAGARVNKFKNKDLTSLNLPSLSKPKED